MQPTIRPCRLARCRRLDDVFARGRLAMGVPGRTCLHARGSLARTHVLSDRPIRPEAALRNHAQHAPRRLHDAAPHHDRRTRQLLGSIPPSLANARSRSTPSSLRPSPTPRLSKRRSQSTFPNKAALLSQARLHLEPRPHGTLPEASRQNARKSRRRARCLSKGRRSLDGAGRPPSDRKARALKRQP